MKQITQAKGETSILQTANSVTTHYQRLCVCARIRERLNLSSLTPYFTFLTVSLWNKKRIIKILTQRHQGNAKKKKIVRFN